MSLDPFDLGLFGHDEGPGLVVLGDDVAFDLPVDSQPPAEDHVSLDAGSGPDQAIDAVLRLAAAPFGSKHARLPGYDTLKLWVSLGVRAPFSNIRTCMPFRTLPGVSLNVPSTR